MEAPSSQEITQLLQAWSAGDESALRNLVPMVRTELRRLASHYMGKEYPGHVLQTTALVNEAYLRLIDWKKASWQDRAHFFCVSARLMRNILVDNARRSPHVEKGRRAWQVSLDEAMVVSRDKSRELVAIDDSLIALEGLDPRKSRIVELRFFGGLKRLRS
jgi:RNA polymerase sigma factor (TIGR02999 family)